MSFIVFPLSQGPLTLGWIFLFIQQFLKYFHSLFVRNYSFAIKLVLMISKHYYIIILLFWCKFTYLVCILHKVLILVFQLDLLDLHLELLDHNILVGGA